MKPLVVSEYGIVPVRDAAWPNRVLRDAGYLAVRREDGREVLDLEESRAFAVCDHQVAHVSVRDPRDLAAVDSLDRHHRYLADGARAPAFSHLTIPPAR